MKTEDARAACDLLTANWRKGTRIDALPNAVRPATRTEGYAVQAFFESHTKSPLFGWKIAATSKAGQAHINVDGPLAGRILAEQVIDNGGVCTLGPNLMRVAELEFAFRFGVDVPPRSSKYSVEDVLTRTASLHPAIEIPDSRFNVFEKAGAPQLIADNACAHQFLLGAASPDTWRSLDLREHVVWGMIGGKPPQQGIGRNVLDDPRVALAWLVNEVTQLGITIKAQQVVTTGTCLAPIAVAPGDMVTGDFGVLGNVKLTFA